jgi:hypothetical protein
MASRSALVALAAALQLGACLPAAAHGPGGIAGASTPGTGPAFDIVHTRVATDGRHAVFRIELSGTAGASRPAPVGRLAGSSVFSYVWPTSLDPSAVGFEPGSGILAFAVTSHPDFDDTPLFDENGDGDPANDGSLWHSHWVVLQPDLACGKDGLKVADIPAGARPRLPRTWPGLPLLIDSPGYSPVLRGRTVEVRVPLDDMAAVGSASFDGVTAALRVNQSVHAPLLCVAQVFKVASGNLSLPGKVQPLGAAAAQGAK